MASKFSNPKVAVPVAVIAIGLAIYITLSTGGDPAFVPHKHYYYDMNTGETFVVHSDTIPPIEAPSKKDFQGKPAGVQIHFYSCSKSCSEKDRFIGFLSTFDDEQRAKALKKDDAIRSIRLPEDKDGDWVLMESAEGQKLYQAVLAKCPAGTRIIPCTPR